jgi:hypothetical protein
VADDSPQLLRVALGELGRGGVEPGERPHVGREDDAGADRALERQEKECRVKVIGDLPLVLAPLDVSDVGFAEAEAPPSSPGLELVERRGKTGFSVLDPDDLRRFEPIETVELPRGSAYLIVDVDTGRDTRNVTPSDALERIEARGRSPLTIEEGIALITHHPEAVAKNGGFALPGSRCGDRRVTALWISAGRPKLGWCWAGNPHTWPGSASCARRLCAES